MDNPWLYINCFQSPLLQCILIESGIFLWWVSRGGGGTGFAWFKRKGGRKKKGGGRLIHLSTLWSKSEFKELLSLATKESYLIFNETFYKQIDGVAMASPLGPTLANASLCFYEEKKGWNNVLMNLNWFIIEDM